MPADVAVDKAVDLAPDKMPDLAPDAAMWPVLDKPVIAFWAEDVKKMYLNTYVANAGDKSMVKLAVTGYGAFSPDGKKMAIASNGLLVMNYPDDSSRTTLVADDKSNYSNESQPKWSPDGKKIAYMFYVYNPDTFVGTDNLNIMAADGSGTPLSLFSSTSESIYSLSWSPAGDKVAFVTKQHGLDVYFRLYEAAADSSTPPAMLRNDDKYVGFGIGSVAYSPDGKTFFITKSENASGSKYGLYTVPASSPSDTPAMVDAVTMYNSEIEFSPDGTRVARGVKVSASLPQPCCDIAASNLDGTMLTTFFSSTTDIVVSPVISWNPASASK
jgi:Tol biopolymer transport system component